MSDPKDFMKNNAEFVAGFPADMHDLLFRLACGQDETDAAYDRIESKMGYSPAEGQYPTTAVIGSCFAPGADPAHLVGTSEVGQTLVGSAPGGVILDALNELNPEAKSFVALSFDLKNIDKVIYALSTGSDLLNKVYDYYRSAETHLDGHYDLPDGVEENSALANYIRTRWGVYETVKAKGEDYYENLLDLDLGDANATRLLLNELKEHGDDKSRFVRAMTIQQLLWGIKAVHRDPHASKAEVVGVLQDVDTKRQYVWSAKTGRLVVIPDQEEKNPRFASKEKIFKSKIPRSLDGIAKGLIEGSREFRRSLAVAATAGHSDIHHICTSSCSDSRALPSTLVGKDLIELCYAFRSPGSFLSCGKELLDGAQRLLQIARNKKKSLIASHHGDCGAMTAIHAYLSGRGESLPPAFKDLARQHVDLYVTVRNKGVCPEKGGDPLAKARRANANGVSDGEILDFYRKLSGIEALKSLPDCLAVQQLLWDTEAAKEAFPAVRVCAVFQNMPEKQNYVLNPATKLFVALPRLQPTTPTPEKKSARALHRHR
jgi:hypothetical protein